MKSKSEAKPTAKRLLSRAEKAMLLVIARKLKAYARSSVTLEKWRAAAYAEQLRRIVKPTGREVSNAAAREEKVAFSCHILLEITPRGHLDRIREFVGEVFSVAPGTVGVYASKHKKTVKAYLEQFDPRHSPTPEYDGLSRKEMLARQLIEIHPKFKSFVRNR